jgi:uncharacterized iron-regulated membrane protein
MTPLEIAAVVLIIAAAAGLALWLEIRRLRRANKEDRQQ